MMQYHYFIKTKKVAETRQPYINPHLKDSFLYIFTLKEYICCNEQPIKSRLQSRLHLRMA